MAMLNNQMVTITSGGMMVIQRGYIDMVTECDICNQQTWCVSDESPI